MLDGTLPSLLGNVTSVSERDCETVEHVALLLVGQAAEKRAGPRQPRSPAKARCTQGITAIEAAGRHRHDHPHSLVSVRPRRAWGSSLGLPSSCRDRGAPLPDRRRRYCEECRRKQLAGHVAKGRERAAAVLAQLRAEQRDPAHGGRAAEIRGAKNAAHQRAVGAWTGELSDPAVFTAEIFPGLRNRSVPELMAATGLGQHYCSLIRLGKKVPHPTTGARSKVPHARHWPAFRRAAE